MEQAGNDECTENTPLTQGVNSIASATGTVERRICALNAILPLIVFGVGVAALMNFEGWPLLLSTYVITQIVTTVGYGEFTVQTQSAKVFMAFYAIAVLIVLAYYHSVLIGSMVSWESEILRKYLRKLEARSCDNITTDGEAKEKFGLWNNAVALLSLFLPFLIFGTFFYRYAEHCSCSYGVQGVEGCIDDSYTQCVLSGGYVKDWASSFYMSSITLTTIGFGDYQPRSELGRVVGIVWMLVGTIITASCLGAISSYLFESHREATFNAKDAVDIDEKAFKMMDKDGNGRLTKGEFLAYTLVKYNLAEEALVDEICMLYDRLDDKKTNGVTFEMIANRSRSGRQKPHLSQYSSA